MQIRGLNRTRASGSKTQRFLDIQPLIASKQVSLPLGGKHNRMCIDHMVKITANNTHRFDDICDTVADAVKVALIDKSLNYKVQRNNEVAGTILSKQKELLQAQRNLYGK